MIDKKCKSIDMHSGISFPYEGFTIDHVNLDDIIHHLSLLNRWSGATRIPFSVLEHSLYCEELVTSCTAYAGGWDRMQLIALLHDAHEMVLTDIPSPLKELFKPFINKLTYNLDIVIYQKFNIRPPNEKEKAYMHDIDRKAMLGEAKAFMPYSVYLRLSDGEINKPDRAPTIYHLNIAQQIYRSRIIGLLEKSKKCTSVQTV